MSHEVGKKVYVQTKYNLIEATVVKVTPKGFTDVKYDHCDAVRRFNPEGELVPQDKWSGVYLLSDEKALQALAWETKKKALIKASQALGQVHAEQRINYQWGKENLQKEIDKLRGLLDAAQQAINEVPE